MAAAQVTFHRLAAAEYRQARDYYLFLSPEVESRFLNAVDITVTRIREAERSHPELKSGYRWVRSAAFRTF
jgi:hypothetical protein